MATVAATVVAHATRKIQHHFFSADAVRADRAVAFIPSGNDEARQFQRMLDRGIIRQEGVDRYWLDAVAYDLNVWREHRQLKFALLILGALLAAALVINVVRSGAVF